MPSLVGGFGNLNVFNNETLITNNNSKSYNYTSNETI